MGWFDELLESEEEKKARIRKENLKKVGGLGLALLGAAALFAGQDQGEVKKEENTDSGSW